MRTRGSGESALLLLDVVDLLTLQNIPYAVVGALAASVHGAVRASMDTDLLLFAGMQKAENLRRDFDRAGFLTELTRGDLDDPIPGLLRLRDAHDNQVDLLLGLRGMDPAALSRVIAVPFQGASLAFIGREDFIAMKLFAGGPLDLVDATPAITGADGSVTSNYYGGLPAGMAVKLASRSNDCWQVSHRNSPGPGVNKTRADKCAMRVRGTHRRWRCRPARC